MKTLTFTQKAEAYRDITLVIKDEELFNQKCKEWVEEGQTLNYYDMEDSFFENSVEVDFSAWDWTEEDNDEFFELMESENIAWEPKE
jgi:hypothetical protein